MGNGIFEIRRYIKSDEDVVFKLHLRAVDNTGAHLPGEDANFKRIEELYVKPGGDFFVGVLNGKIVACGGLKKLSATSAEIVKIRIDPDFQRKGYGQKILDKIEDRAVELGFVDLELNTAVVQEPAQKLYEKNGYIEYMREPVEGIPNIYYRKKIKILDK